MSEAELRDEEDEGELVHWFDRAPVSASPGVATAALAGSFALGLLAGAGLIALFGRMRD